MVLLMILFPSGCISDGRAGTSTGIDSPSSIVMIHTDGTMESWNKAVFTRVTIVEGDASLIYQKRREWWHAHALNHDGTKRYFPDGEGNRQEHFLDFFSGLWWGARKQVS
jgi:hypothetical protein